MEQDKVIMARVPKSLHRDVRVRAAELGIPVSEIIRRLLRLWLSGKINLPEN
jgi:predicted DNA binding CopG/RHH family protein